MSPTVFAQEEDQISTKKSIHHQVVITLIPPHHEQHCSNFFTYRSDKENEKFQIENWKTFT